MLMKPMSLLSLAPIYGAACDGEQQAIEAQPGP